MRDVATIGVYGFDGQSHLEALSAHGVELLLDVRQRRGVRGREYAWANSQRLQAALAQAGIGYRHLRELAPTTELREVQYREDARTGVGKRSRRQLATEYRERYEREILDSADLAGIFAPLGRTRVVLLCVERDPAACHRSLIADRLREMGWRVEHILPEASASGG